MQEGGGWTKELEDALEREWESLKKLNQVELEKSKHQSSVSKLQTQHSAVQTKLELALANAEMAAEREQQAEDRLDAGMSLHARQMSQRPRSRIGKDYFWSWICLDRCPTKRKENNPNNHCKRKF
jgi:hypothetical protein